MARALWSGSISFGLVNIPVKVTSAVKDRDLHFHMLHGKDGGRIRFRRVCQKDDAEVDNADIVKGYEFSRGQYVTFTDEELEAVDPKASRTIDIVDFVGQGEIDPSYFDKPYYLMPDKNADKPYALLCAALGRSGKVGIARVVMREKEYLVALRLRDGLLMMETMHFADEVVPPEEIAADMAPVSAVDPRQVKMAQQLIDGLTTPFDAARYTNEHRKRVLEVVQRKAEGQEVVLEAEARPAARPADLMEALEASLSEVRRRPRPAPTARRKRTTKVTE